MQVTTRLRNADASRGAGAHARKEATLTARPEVGHVIRECLPKR